MKVIYSLQEFHDKAVKISGKEKKHVSVAAELGLFNRIEFRCYADGCGSFIATTMEESLEKMDRSINPDKFINTSIVDVEIDIPKTEAEENV